MKLKPLRQRYHQYGYFPEHFPNPVISKAIELHANYPFTETEESHEDSDASEQANSTEETAKSSKRPSII